MFPEMRKKNLLMSEEDSKKILKEGEYGVLSTVGVNGYPYGIGLNYVYKNEKIYFHCAPDVGSKLENIKQNSKVSFFVVGEAELLPKIFSTRYTSVVVFGEASEVMGEEKFEALTDFIDKYSSDYKESGTKYVQAMCAKTAIYAISIDHITGKDKKG